MRKKQAVPSESKRRLLDAAGRLFAEHGFDRISIRDVSTAAEANVAAVNYHFGSRQNLMELVVTQHILPVLDERSARFEALEKRPAAKAAPVEEVLDAFARPVLGAIRKSEFPENLCCRMMARIFSLLPEELPSAVAAQIKPLQDRFVRLLGRSLPGLGHDELQWRAQFAVGGMVQMLADPEALQRLSGGGSSAMEVALGRFIRFAAEGLREGMESQPTKTKGPQATFDF